MQFKVERICIQQALEETEGHVTRAASLLEQAAALAEDADFGHYLTLRAQALVTDDYQPSDMAWLDMKNNPIIPIAGAKY